jgi:glycosyltransferase involved in cell wall biosynthesis
MIKSVDERGIYTDLMREFVKNGNDVYIVSPVERRLGLPTKLIHGDKDEFHKRVHILWLKTGNIQKTNIIEKGVSTILLESKLISGIKKYLSDVKFDLVLYSTPPITFFKAVEYVKKRDNAKTYLLLKDIFPQNAVDLGMMKKRGIKGLIYKYFRRKEKKLYAISDKIGCMSPANIEYTLRMNPEIPSDKVEVCPNSVEYSDMSITDDERNALRKKYDIPLDKKVFVYGGNLGKPQGIPFIIECLKAEADNKDVFFLIVGSGTEFPKLEEFVSTEKPNNVKLMKQLPKEDYDKMVAACDVGMIFLDHRFTIPNFPSRLLAYMQAGIPVLACTDPNTDIGKVIVEGGFGWWCESNSTEDFMKIVNFALSSDLDKMGRRGVEYLLDNYTVEKSCEIIEKIF